MDTSKVYVQIDASGRITRCEGGYTTPADLTGWTEIGEGDGDKYNLCQSHYFDGGLYTQDGICRYRYSDGICSLRTDAEIAADRASKPAPPSTAEDTALDLLADHEYRICMMELNGSAQ